MLSTKVKEKSSGKEKKMLLLAVLLVPVVALIIVVAAPQAWANEEPEFEDGEIFFELNDTDGDLGIHGEVDGGPWKQVWVKNNRHRTLLNVIARGKLRRQLVTEFNFESAEPTFEDLDPDVFFGRFPEGEYTIFGLSEDNIVFSTTTDVTHVMPAPPGLVENVENGYEVRIDLIGEVTVEDVVDKDKCDDEDPALNPAIVAPDKYGNIVISWPAVTTSHPTIGTPDVDISEDVVRYQGVVEFETEDEFEVISITDLPPSDTPSFTVPAAILDLAGDELIKYEILVREESGNQTAVESCFVVDGNGG